ncbi:hypothetical protein FACS1894184_16900 [Clostridia bacterium]|nr:hypothetical protein FACS1894184_16900 [Clostridia bacterium]
MQLLINSFICEYANWEELLSHSPYYIRIKRKDGYILLKYEQTRSDFTIPVVRECRGLILDETDNYRPVCVPFFKFGNFGEQYVPDIDWPSARVQEKIDGSLIKLWHDKGMWHISSNGEIDARDARIGSALSAAPITNLYDIFMEAWVKTGVDIEYLPRGYSFMFELTSPHNRVVVRFDEASVWHIGTREMSALLECDMDIGIVKPRAYSMKNLEECIDAARILGSDAEGFVVVDKDYNRVKIKSPKYVELSHLAAGAATREDIVSILQRNEQDEFLSYFPEYNAVFAEIAKRIDAFAERQQTLLTQIRSCQYTTRKELAAVITKTECPACLFTLIDGKSPSARDWLMNCPADKALRWISLRE